MKRMVLLFGVVMVLVACQQENSSIKENESSQNVVEEDVGTKKETRALVEIEENILHKWALTEDTDVVLVKDSGELEVLADTTALGEEGERQYQGDLSLYIVYAGEEVGYLQEKMTDVTINLDRGFSTPYWFRDEPIITWSQPESSNNLTTKMWRYTNGELQRVLFDGNEEQIWTNKEMKFLKDEYLQVYYYNNHDMENGIGWYYETWKWDEDHQQFTLHDERAYTDAQEYGWESGEQLTKMWHEREDEYILFPEIMLMDGLSQHIQAGKLEGNGVFLGQSIDDVLAKMPDYTMHEYFGGAMYYSFPGPYSYFYDELTREVTFVLMSGASLMNDLTSLKEILGQPESEGYDEVEWNYFANFMIEDKSLRVEHDEEGTVTGLWLSNVD